jgi:hypothetical protein
MVKPKVSPKISNLVVYPCTLPKTDFESCLFCTKGHGTVAIDEMEPTYLSTTIWKDQASFDKWRKGTAFKKAHGQKPPSESSAEKPAGPPKPMWSKPPQPLFYQGTLVISSEEGS